MSLAKHLAALTSRSGSADSSSNVLANADDFGDGTNTYAQQLSRKIQDLNDDQIDEEDDDDEDGVGSRSMKYAGKTISRKQLLKEMQNLQSSSDEEDSDSDSDSGDDSDDDDNADSDDDENEDESSDSDSNPIGPTLEKGKTRLNNGDGDNNDDGDDDNEEDEDEEEDDKTTVSVDAIQQQLDQLEDEDAMAFVSRREVSEQTHARQREQVGRGISIALLHSCFFFCADI